MAKYGWQIRGIVLQDNQDLAEKLGVNRTPTLVLIKKGDGRFIPISNGVLALDEIEKNLYRGIRLLEGQTTPQNWSLYNFQKGGGFDTQYPQGENSGGQQE